MVKRINIFLSAVAFIVTTSIQATTKPIDCFIKKIESATLNHDMQTMTKLLTKEFFQMQYVEIHEKDITRLSNEYFCGMYQSKYKCMVFNDIIKIEAIKIIPLKETKTSYTVTFEVTNNKKETIQTINTWITKTIVNEKTTFGLYGPGG